MSPHCVDIPNDPKSLYEPCTVQNGVDDCDLGLLCWDIGGRGHDICVGLCDGDGDRCTCLDPKVYYPSIYAAAEVGLCFPGCDPFLQDCQEDQLCIPNGGAFLCVLDASGDAGAINDPCEFANACDKGLVCLNTPIASSACMQKVPGCCQPLCNFANNDPCPNPDQSCVPWYDPMNPMMEAPPGLEELGVCAIPSP